MPQERVYNEGWRRELVRVQRVQNKVGIAVFVGNKKRLRRSPCGDSLLSSRIFMTWDSLPLLYTPLILQPLWEKYVERRRRIAKECKAFNAREAAGAGGSGGAGGPASADATMPRSPPALVRTPSGGIPGGKTITTANEMWLLHGTSGYVLLRGPRKRCLVSLIDRRT